MRRSVAGTGLLALSQATWQFSRMRGDVGNRLIEFEIGEGMTVSATDSPDSPLLGLFFTGYDRAFILPDEREEMAGFKACLALNTSHRHAFGRTHSELVCVFRNGDGVLLGGANFLATAIDRERALASIALNYVYVEQAARGKGLLRRILATICKLALTALELGQDAPGPAIFIEQNDPLRLSEEDYRNDTAHSGTDQVDRLTIWSRLGTRVVDFGYIQPALSAEQEPDDGLILGAVGFAGEAIDPALLHDHLESFFGISVLKGKPSLDEGVCGEQLRALAAMDRPVPLLPMEAALALLRDEPTAHGHDSFRQLARAALDED